jgi:hypothetical protein
MKNNFGIPISFSLFPVKETTERIRPSSRQKQMKLLKNKSKDSQL